MTIGRPRNVSDNEILDAYDRVLHQVGPARLTLALVAREAGVVPATLIQRMGSKRNLIARATERGEARIQDIFESATTDQVDPISALEEAVRQLLSGVRTTEEMANSIAALHSEITDSDSRAGVVRQTRAIQAGFTQLIAQSSGDIDADRLGRMAYIAYSGALMAWAIDGEGSLADSVIAAIREVVLGAI